MNRSHIVARRRQEEAAAAQQLREKQLLNRDREILLCYYGRHDKAMANPSKIMRMLNSRAKRAKAAAKAGDVDALDWREQMYTAIAAKRPTAGDPRDVFAAVQAKRHGHAAIVPGKLKKSTQAPKAAAPEPEPQPREQPQHELRTPPVASAAIKPAQSLVSPDAARAERRWNELKARRRASEEMAAVQVRKAEEAATAACAESTEALRRHNDTDLMHPAMHDRIGQNSTTKIPTVAVDLSNSAIAGESSSEINNRETVSSQASEDSVLEREYINPFANPKAQEARDSLATQPDAAGAIRESIASATAVTSSLFDSVPTNESRVVGPTHPVQIQPGPSVDFPVSPIISHDTQHSEPDASVEPEISMKLHRQAHVAKNLSEHTSRVLKEQADIAAAAHATTAVALDGKVAVAVAAAERRHALEMSKVRARFEAELSEIQQTSTAELEREKRSSAAERADAVAATVRAAERELRAALADAAEEAARSSRQATKAWDAEKAELQQQIRDERSARSADIDRADTELRAAVQAEEQAHEVTRGLLAKAVAESSQTRRRLGDTEEELRRALDASKAQAEAASVDIAAKEAEIELLKQTISELNVDAAEAKDKFQAEQRTAAVAAAEAAAKAEQELIKLRAAGEQQIADLSAEATAAVERSEEVALHQRRNAEQTKLALEKDWTMKLNDAQVLQHELRQEMKEAEKQHQTELEQALSTSGQQIREIKDSAARAAAQAVKAVRSEMEHSIEDIRIAHEQKVAIIRQQCNDELNHKLETQRRDLENEAEHKLSEALSAAAKCTQEVQEAKAASALAVETARKEVAALEKLCVDEMEKLQTEAGTGSRREMPNESLYSLLGVGRDCSDVEITRAFRRQAQKTRR